MQKRPPQFTLSCTVFMFFKSGNMLREDKEDSLTAGIPFEEVRFLLMRQLGSLKKLPKACHAQVVLIMRTDTKNWMCEYSTCLTPDSLAVDLCCELASQTLGVFLWSCVDVTPNFVFRCIDCSNVLTLVPV
jgi:hypothetical protein